MQYLLTEAEYKKLAQKSDVEKYKNAAMGAGVDACSG